MRTPLHKHEAGPPRAWDQILRDAVTVLTEAARATGDFAEFLTHAVAGVAANVGGIDALLAGRPGSWEAHYVRDMLTSTVGEDETDLLQHRTEPLRVVVNVDDLLTDLGYAQVYDQAHDELNRREDAIYANSPVLTDGQDAALAALEELRERLDAQHDRDWTAYADAFTTNVHTAADDLLPGLRVPVEVAVELGWQNDLGAGADYASLEFRLWERARDQTPLPGTGIPLCDYPPGVDIVQAERDAGRTPIARLDAEGSEQR